MAPLAAIPASNSVIRVSATLVGACAAVALLYFGRDFFITLAISTLLAFLLDPAVVAVTRLKIPRALATCIIIAGAFVLMYLAGVLLWSQVSTLAEDLPGYSARVAEIVDKLNTDLDDLEQRTLTRVVPKTLREQEQQIQEKPREAMKARRRRSNGPPTASGLPPEPPAIQEVTIHQTPKPVLATLYAFASRYFHLMIMASFVPFLVFFMLSWRDRLAAGMLGLLPGRNRGSVEQTWMDIGESTRAYVVGNLMLWVFLSVVSASVFFFMSVPYWPLVGVLSAALSLVPYAGLPLSVIPPAAAALAIPNKFKIVIALIVITGLLHVFAMNFLYPKIVGRRVRLNPLIVTVSLMFWGVMWGGIGLVLAVPITAAIKATCDNIEELRPYGALLGD